MTRHGTYALTHGTPRSGPRPKPLTDEERRDQKRIFETAHRIALDEEEKNIMRSDYPRRVMLSKSPKSHLDNNNCGVACGNKYAHEMSSYLSDITCKTCYRIFKIRNGGKV
jgi:hypothetical protein